MKTILNKINKFIGVGFTGLWIVLILIFYLRQHPEYFYSIKNFQYKELLILFFIGITIIYFRKRWLKKFRLPPILYTGIGLWIGIILMASFLYFFQFYKLGIGMDFQISMFFFFLYKLIILQVWLIFITAFSFGIGQFLLSKLVGFDLPKLDNLFISICLGIIIITLILMALGAFSLLKDFVLIPIFLIGFLLLWRKEKYFFQKIFLTRIQFYKSLSFFGFISLFLLLVWVTINFINIARPIPFGYDSLTLYLKLPALINDYGSLVKGYQPYYWSLFMSLGYLLFKQTEYVLALSFLGSLLSLIGFFILIKRWLSINKSIFCLLLFYSLPSINFLVYGDVKVDLGLLSLLFCLLILLINWIVFEEQIEPIKNELSKPNHLWFSILLGVFSGFAIGVKLTAIFAVFGIIHIFAYSYFNLKGLITIFLLTIFSILLIQLDRLNGMRDSFLGLVYVQWTCGLIGIGLATYFSWKWPKKSLALLKTSTIYFLFLGLTFAPWLAKNYAETGEINTNSLLSGRSNNTQINYQILFEQWYKKQ